jgi:uncharacterized protein YbjT (DUF2867 family)
MSRRASPGDGWPGSEWVQADVVTGAGLAAAVEGVDTVVHAASAGYSRSFQTDIEGTRRLLDAARSAGVAHIVYISIVGIDKVPYAYGKAKLAAERLIQQSGAPWSILRATQFHYALDSLLQFMTRPPLVALLPTDLLVQPVAEEEVARRLVEIAQAAPSCQVEDMGGPEVFTTGALTRIWLRRRAMRRAIIPLWLPGKMGSALRQGGNTCPRHATGTVAWEAWLQQRYG